MAILNKLTGAFPTSILYITFGSLLTVWTAIWLFFNTPLEDKSKYFWPVGFLATGLCVLAIGLLLGRIGRSAKKAELAPEEMAGPSANAEQTAAARPTVVPGGVMGNQVVQPNAVGAVPPNAPVQPVAPVGHVPAGSVVPGGPLPTTVTPATNPEHIRL